MEGFVSSLDTARFGFKIARIDGYDGGTATIIESLKKEGVKMVIARVNTGDIAAINSLEDKGFRVMDTQITYKYEISGYRNKPYALPGDIKVRQFIRSDTNAITEIARKAFDNYGHYFADLRLDRGKCREIYSDWATRSCGDAGVADAVFTAEGPGGIAGFATYKIYARDGARYAACGLGAVDDKFRGKGIYGVIIDRALQWGAEAGLKWEEYSCIACNFPANRAYIKAGFMPYGSFMTLHLWQD